MFWRRLRDALRPETVHAHCDIPCGIYDPHNAQVAAQSVLRMVDLIEELPRKEADETTKRQLFGRYVKVKEDHAEMVKHEVRVLWGDYFTEEHLKEVPDLHDLVWDAMKKASKARQTVDRKAAQDLIEATNKVAEAFWKTKGLETDTVKAPYPPARSFVAPRYEEAVEVGHGDGRAR